LYFKVGANSTATTTLTNTSPVTLFIARVSLTGSGANDFSFNSACGTTLAGGHSCTISLSTVATHSGFLGTLVESDNSALGRHEVKLFGQ